MRAILHSELCGTADGITLLKLLIKENPRYDKYHIAVPNIIRKYKKYLQTEISESNTIISAILNDEISESGYLEILHNAINEIASSHMARRTFIGNIYKLVKDPNLVSALIGHVEGSRAFTRYRTIDIDMKKDLVKILEGKQ